jgi:hypothetical protein
MSVRVRGESSEWNSPCTFVCLISLPFTVQFQAPERVQRYIPFHTTARLLLDTGQSRSEEVFWSGRQRGK